MLFEHALNFVLGVILGTGMMISGVLRPSKIEGFFTLDSDKWDPTLLVVIFTGGVVTMIIFVCAYGKA